EEKVSEYKAKLDEMERQFDSYASARKIQGEEETARALHEFLWEGMPCVKSERHILYPEAIDIRINSKPIYEKNCVGYSSLCAMLGLKKGVRFTVLCNQSHVMLRLKQEKPIDIECTWPSGFGIDITKSRFSGHQKLREYGLIALSGIAYNERGAAKAMRRCYHKAIDLFNKAIDLMPDDAHVYANRGRTKIMVDDWDGAEEDFAMYRKLKRERR
ncbi:MAG TPA: hypothetical protein HA362_06905, partial [Nanoarchaeota archaeon]|nr:hypothetical protein [Nanoarchaeota archaeon]